jgi:hypothetical protein
MNRRGAVGKAIRAGLLATVETVGGTPLIHCDEAERWLKESPPARPPADCRQAPEGEGAGQVSAGLVAFLVAWCALLAYLPARMVYDAWRGRRLRRAQRPGFPVLVVKERPPPE